MAGPMVAPGPAYSLPMTAAEVLPVAYSPATAEPSSRSTRLFSSQTRPPLVPRSPTSMRIA